MMVALNPRTIDDFQELAGAGLLQGIFPGIAGDDYHRKLPGTSKSSVELAALSPANMIARQLRSSDEESDALLRGTMLHSRIEHRENMERYKSLFVTMPEFSGTGSRAARAEWIENNKDKRVLDGSMTQEIEEMFAGLMANPQSKALIEAPGHYEDTVFWIDPDTGVLCKCRPDKWLPDYLGSPMTVDWKTIGKFSKRDCQIAIEEYHYYVSAAFTIDGLRAVGRDPGPYVFVFIQSKAPNNVLCVPAQEIDIDIGRKEYKKILAQIAESQKSGIWPGFVELGMSDYTRQRKLESLAML